MLNQLITGCLSLFAKCDLLRQRFTNYGLCAFEQHLHDHPLYLVCPDVLSLVGEPSSGDGCGSPNQI